MVNNMVYSIVFSPTGGTQRVMDVLGREFGVMKKVDLSLNKSFSDVSFTANDVCLIGVPSYGGRVPAVALERLKQIKGNGAKAVCVVVFGNRAYDDTLLELKNEAEAIGFSVQAGIAANAEHSIVRRFGAGRPDMKDKEELKLYAQTIKNKIRLVNDNALSVPGNYPYKSYGGSAIKPRASKRCMGCGFCAARCPVGAIPEDRPYFTDENKCISCMRCLTVCPQGARELDRDMLAAVTMKLADVCVERKKNELFV